MAPPPPVYPAPQPAPQNRKRGRPRKNGGDAAAQQPQRHVLQPAAAGWMPDAPFTGFRWGGVNVLMPRKDCLFTGETGPTYVGEQRGMAGAARREQEKQSKLFYFEKFIDSKFREMCVVESNKYVAAMGSKPQPATLHSRFPWPPKWREKCTGAEENGQKGLDCWID